MPCIITFLLYVREITDAFNLMLFTELLYRCTGLLPVSIRTHRVNGDIFLMFFSGPED